MQILKNNWLIVSTTAIMLLFGMFFLVNATENTLKKEPTIVKTVATTYYFTGTDLSQSTDPEHWTDNPDEAPACQGAPVLPCSITLNESIEDFVENKTPSQIMSTPGLSKRSN